MFTKRKLSASLGMEVSGLDLSKPVSKDVHAELRDLFTEAGLLVFRDQSFTKSTLVDASRIFGELEVHPIETVRDDEVPEIITLATHGKNDDICWEDDELMVGGSSWHVDMGYVTRPCRGALLYGVVHPAEGGRTGFLDCAAAYDALDDAMKQRIANFHVIQSWRYSISREETTLNANFKDKDGGEDHLELEKFPDLIFPMVMTHPESGRRVLNVVPHYASDIVELPGEEGWKLIDRLIAHLVQPQFLYWHHWLPGDAVLWDNWRTNHAAEGCKAKFARKMWRTTLVGDRELGRNLKAGEYPSKRIWDRPDVPLLLTN